MNGKEGGIIIKIILLPLKGIMIGMLVALPIGPLGLLSIQRTINRGWKIGFLSGVGAAASDLIYSSIAIIGISFISDFLKKYRFFFNGIIGTLFLIVGINILMNAIENKTIKEESKEDSAEEIQEEIMHPALSNFLMGLSNPMTFLIFLGIFTKLGIHRDAREWIHNLVFVLSIFIGSSILWFITTNLIERSRKNYKIESFVFIDKVIGILIILFGIFTILDIKGII